jgi:phosphoribosyl 1,2-cyclic phosphodiesterase
VGCWGTRGSVPSPGPDTVRFGGNTSCVELLTARSRIILDAGTGIRALGEGLDIERRTSIFLTHFHWDHIQGFPFFKPAYTPDFDLRIVGPEQDGVGVEALLAGQMGPMHFPLLYDDFKASISFHHLNEGVWEGEDFLVRAFRIRHSCFTVGYRVEAAGSSVVFIPDNELLGGPWLTPTGWMDDLVAFAGDTDLLIHDAMFTDEEYGRTEGWGHSTFSQTLELAGHAGAKSTLFFHHAPFRSDDALATILGHYQRSIEERGSNLGVDVASEEYRAVFDREKKDW